MSAPATASTRERRQPKRLEAGPANVSWSSGQTQEQAELERAPAPPVTEQAATTRTKRERKEPERLEAGPATVRWFSGQGAQEGQEQERQEQQQEQADEQRESKRKSGRDRKPVVPQEPPGTNGEPQFATSAPTPEAATNTGTSLSSARANEPAEMPPARKKRPAPETDAVRTRAIRSRVSSDPIWTDCLRIQADLQAAAKEVDFHLIDRMKDVISAWGDQAEDGYASDTINLPFACD